MNTASELAGRPPGSGAGARPPAALGVTRPHALAAQHPSRPEPMCRCCQGTVSRKSPSPPGALQRAVTGSRCITSHRRKHCPPGKAVLLALLHLSLVQGKLRRARTQGVPYVRRIHSGGVIGDGFGQGCVMIHVPAVPRFPRLCPGQISVIKRHSFRCSRTSSSTHLWEASARHWRNL